MPSSPISYADILGARARIAPHLDGSPVRNYPLLDTLVGHDIRVLVKHENHLPVNSFKVRNATSALTAIPTAVAARGVAGASTGNHGQGRAWAGARLGIPVTICVPVGNNPEKMTPFAPWARGSSKRGVATTLQRPCVPRSPPPKGSRSSTRQITVTCSLARVR